MEDGGLEEEEGGKIEEDRRQEKIKSERSVKS